MPKALFVANVVKTHIVTFCLPHLKLLRKDDLTEKQLEIMLGRKCGL